MGGSQNPQELHYSETGAGCQCIRRIFCPITWNFRAAQSLGMEMADLVTVTGWVLLAGGLYRMIAPGAPQATANAGNRAMFAAIVVIGTA
jgi:hypothetical protein